MNIFLNIFLLLVCGFAGVAFHTISKYSPLKEDAEKANLTLSFRKFLERDWTGITLSFLSVFIWLLVYKEVINVYAKINLFTNISFVALGLLGSYPIQLFTSKTKKWIRKQVDEKTNIADSK